MAHRLPTRRLFWKLYLALTISMVLSIAGTVLYLSVNGIKPPAPQGEPVMGFIPVVPLLSSFIVITLVAFALAWYLSRPIVHLQWALRRVASGQFDTRVQPLIKGQRDEIADLALEFDGMAEQLQIAVDSQRQLLHDISHELRSPLSRLETAIGLIRQNPECEAEMLERIETESARLNALIEELLTLYRLEAGAPALPRERVDLIELLHAIADDADFEARAKNRRVRIDAPCSFVADVQGELIYRAFENVIRNAVKYAPEDSSIDIMARVNEYGLKVTVSDRGAGVPAEMMDSIFQPFVRLEQHAGIKRGTGLGLAIARRAMQMHAATVKAKARDGGGLEVVFDIPINSTH